MLSPARRRAVVQRLCERFEASERRACRVIDQARSTQRYKATVKGDEAKIIQRMHALVRRYPRYGYRRVHAMLAREGFRLNRKRTWRLWKKEGFKVPRKARKKRRLGCGDNGIMRRRAQAVNDVWCWDFIHDRDEGGRALKWLLVEDEYTREGLVVEVERSMKAADVVDVITGLMLRRGAPRHVRSDNGPEFIAHAIRHHLGSAAVQTLYIEPGAPWQNGYAESFGGRFRDELLNCEVFADLREAKALSGWWKIEYNTRRPHSSLGYKTPAEFAASCASPLVGLATLALPTAMHTTGQDQPTLIALGT